MSNVKVLVEGIEVDKDDYTLPSERTFREAWSFAGNADAGVISVDMDAAKNIWRDKIRQARVKPLATLDTDYMRALEIGADTTQITASKQALRDAPADPAIDAATTPEELKLVQPAGLTVE